jgi:hypothetical protein
VVAWRQSQADEGGHSAVSPGTRSRDIYVGLLGGGRTHLVAGCMRL